MIKFAFAFERICSMKFAFHEYGLFLASSHPQTIQVQSTMTWHQKSRSLQLWCHY